MLPISPHAAHGNQPYLSWQRTRSQALPHILALMDFYIDSPGGCFWISAVRYQRAAPAAGNTGITYRYNASGTSYPVSAPHYYRLLSLTASGLPARLTIYPAMLQSKDSLGTPVSPVPGTLLCLYKASSLISSSTCCCISRMIGDTSGSPAACMSFFSS